MAGAAPSREYASNSSKHDAPDMYAKQLANLGNLRNAWKQLKEWGSNDAGRGQIKEAMQLCPAANLSSDDDEDMLAHLSSR
ncbi:TPA: hypothetical protein ACH3X2_005185 [Trebouxia sp. C0005]